MSPDDIAGNRQSDPGSRNTARLVFHPIIFFEDSLQIFGCDARPEIFNTDPDGMVRRNRLDDNGRLRIRIL